MTRKTQLLELAFTQWSSYAHAGAEFPQGPSRDGKRAGGRPECPSAAADVLARLEELSAGLRDQMGDNVDLWENAPNRYGKAGRMY